MTKITILAGGVGGARFTRGLLAHLHAADPSAAVTVIANTGDDLWLTGLRVCPDLDSIMYTLGGANDDERGWGRKGESERVSAELAAYGVGWPWFTLGDLDLGTHIARSAWLRDGLPLSEATARLAARWNLGVTLLPATDDEVETIVTVAAEADDADADATAAPTTEDMHFEEWWVRLRASRPALAFTQRNVAASRPAPGVLEAIADGRRRAVRAVEPRGVHRHHPRHPGHRGCRSCDAALRSSASRPSSAAPSCAAWPTPASAPSASRPALVAVARHYGAPQRRRAHRRLAASTRSTPTPSGSSMATGIRSAARPLWFSSVEETAAIAAAALGCAAPSAEPHPA